MASLIGISPSTLFLQLNDYEIRKGKKIGVTVSYNNHRLFVGNIPKNRDRDDLFEEFTKHARKLTIVLKSASSNQAEVLWEKERERDDEAKI